MAALEAHDLVAGYHRGRTRTPVLDVASLAAPAGQLVAVIGPNGGGKSTLLRTLIGAQPPLRGVVRLDGTSVADLDRRERARRIAVVLTDRVDPGLLTVGDVVELGRHPHTGWSGYLTAEDVEIAHAAAAHLGVLAMWDRPFAVLSDGQRRQAGEHGEGTIPHRQHAEVGGGGVGDLDVLGGQVAAPAGVGVAAELDDVADGEQPRVHPVGQHHGDAARPFAPVEVGERCAVEAHHAAQRRLGTDQCAQQRRLATAVGPDHGDELAGRCDERCHVEHRRARPSPVIPGDQVVRLEGGHHVITSVRARRVSTHTTTGTPISAVTALSGSTPR